MTFLEWTTDDWDPALRFWTLPYDRQLTDGSNRRSFSTYIMAGREFGGQPRIIWQFDRARQFACEQLVGAA